MIAFTPYSIKRSPLLLFWLAFFPAQLFAQPDSEPSHPKGGRSQSEVRSAAQPITITLTQDAAAHKVTILAGGRPLTEFIYPGTLPNPTLYPIYPPAHHLITPHCPPP